MTAHLPECSYLPDVQADVDGRFCVYCVPLRACEQRVRTAMHTAEREEYLNGLYEGRNDGYAAGVQAVRDAVAALRMGDSGAVDVDYALAVIDALKGDANG